MGRLAWWTFAILLVIAGLLQSCTTLEKRIEKAKTVAYQNPNSFADFCARIFPPKDSIGEPIIRYIPADNKDYSKRLDSIMGEAERFGASVKSDTSETGKLYRRKIESLSERIKSLQKDYKKCVPDTIRTEIPIYRSNTAKEVYLSTALIKLDKELYNEKIMREKAEKQSKNRLWILLGLSALIVGAGALWIFKRR